MTISPYRKTGHGAMHYIGWSAKATVFRIDLERQNNSLCLMAVNGITRSAKHLQNFAGLAGRI